MSQVDTIITASKLKKSDDWSDVSIGINSDTIRNFFKCAPLVGFLENSMLLAGAVSIFVQWTGHIKSSMIKLDQ